jgi:hypothetical protein
VAAAKPDHNPALPIWVGRGRVPDGTKGDAQPDYSDVEVKLSGARFSRYRKIHLKTVTVSRN